MTIPLQQKARLYGTCWEVELNPKARRGMFQKHQAALTGGLPKGFGKESSRIWSYFIWRLPPRPCFSTSEQTTLHQFVHP